MVNCNGTCSTVSATSAVSFWWQMDGLCLCPWGNTWKVYCFVTGKGKLVLAFWSNGYRKQSISKIYHHFPEGCKLSLIFSYKSNHVWYGNCNWRGDFIQFSVIYSHSPSVVWFSNRPNRIIKSGHGFLNNSHLLKCLSGLSNFLLYPWNTILFYSYHLGKHGQYNRIPLLEPTQDSCRSNSKSCLWSPEAEVTI